MDVAARGSTLVDLFVIVAIVVILAATLFPVFAKLSAVQQVRSDSTGPESGTDGAPCLAEGPHQSGPGTAAALVADDGRRVAESEAQRAGLLGWAAVACAAVMIGILIEGGRRS